MKKIILMSAVFIFVSAISLAKANIPAATTKAFNQKFPNAKNVKWAKENKNNYEAEFEWLGVNYSANFSETGKWLETESPYTFNQLSEKVQAAFSLSHKGVTAKAVSKIETSKQGIIYEIEFSKGIKTIELFYKSDGTETKE